MSRFAKVPFLPGVGTEVQAWEPGKGTSALIHAPSACLLVCSDPVAKHKGRQSLIYSLLTLSPCPWGVEKEVLCLCVYFEGLRML